MEKEFRQIVWDEVLEDDCRQLVRLAVREDLNRHCDVTTLALVGPNCDGRADVMARQPGVVCGLRAVAVVLDTMEICAEWQPLLQDGQSVEAGVTLGHLAGAARDLLTAERLLLNLIGRLSGVATQAHRYVQRIAGTHARIYDTRKTTPGWRRLEKYAVRCGGGRNHRTGLFDAVLIKDNHLAHVAQSDQDRMSPGQAVDFLRERLEQMLPERTTDVIVEVEVDSLDQLDDVLPHRPDIVLLDNMSLDQLRAAVERRDAAGVDCELEASGGVTLDTIRAIAETGVDRISVGALTHAAISLDVSLDWAGRSS